MRRIYLSAIFTLLSNLALAEPVPIGGKACKEFNSIYGDDLAGVIARSTVLDLTDSEYAHKLALEGLEVNEIKYYVAVRSNCIAHVKAMEKLYEKDAGETKSDK